MYTRLIMWKSNHFRIFISHPSVVKKGAHELKTLLTPFQIDAFVAHDDIEPGLEWQGEIETALQTMDAMLAIITPDFSASKWCDQEVGFALGSRKLVLPISNDVNPHGFLGKVHALKVTGLNMEQVAAKVSGIIVKHPQSSSAMSEAIVKGIVNSSSWDKTRRLMKLLELLSVITFDQADRLQKAASENKHVREAWIGSATAADIIKKLANDRTPF